MASAKSCLPPKSGKPETSLHKTDSTLKGPLATNTVFDEPRLNVQRCKSQDDQPNFDRNGKQGNLENSACSESLFIKVQIDARRINRKIDENF